MSSWLSARQPQAEWMDAPDADPAELARALQFIRRINRFLGYTRATVGHFARFARSWPAGRTMRVLDVATGSADIPRALLAWAKANALGLEIVGVDLHSRTLDDARAQGQIAGLSLLQADARALPFDDRSFDYVITAMFMHHLSDADVVAVLREMDRVAARGVVVADLLRSRRAYVWVKLLTSLAGPMVRHDAAVSVEQSFSRDEIVALRDRAGLNYATFHEHFGHRFVLAGERRVDIHAD